MKKTILVVAFLFIALCLAAGGYALGEVSDDNEPISVQSGYYDENGQFHVSRTGSGVIGGSKDKQESTETGSVICYALAGIAGLGGMITLFTWRKDT